MGYEENRSCNGGPHFPTRPMPPKKKAKPAGSAKDQFPESGRLCPRVMTPLYGKPSDVGFGIIGSVNAGNSDLEVISENGISKQFTAELKKCGQKVNAYGGLHKHCLEIAESRGSGLLYRSSFPEKFHAIGVRAVFTQTSPLRDSAIGGKFCEDGVHAGTVFVDVFDREKSPAGDERNQAMVYVVGPCGKEDGLTEDEFLQACRAAGEGVSRAVRGFNMAVRADQSYAPLEYVRMCLVSGGENCHPDLEDAPDKVAEALIAGVGSAYDAGHSPKFEFASGPDSNPFAAAFRKL